VDAPAPPEGLGQAGRGLWELVWRDGSGWLSRADVPLVSLLCEAADERERWLALVANEGPTFTTEKGYVGIHPAVSQVRALGREMMTMLGLLGFTPSDRARLGLAEVRRMTHLSDLVERRRADLGR
jgi:P27 family predicted phage terminase small subunit